MCRRSSSRLLGHVVRGDEQADGSMIPTNVKQPRKRWLRQWAIVSSVLTTLGVSMTFVSGCESPVATYCVARCDCQGCSQVERGDCLDDVDDAQRLAEHDGCTSKFDDYMSCYADTGTCVSGAWIASTCTIKGSALRDCSERSAKFVKTACEEEIDKRASCGLTGGGTGPCGPGDECAAFCALQAPCEELVNPSGTNYSNCVSDCTSSSSSVGSSGGP